MKKIISLTLLCVILLISLTSCKLLVKMTYNDEGLLTDGSNEYKFAPSGYEPTYQGDEYALIKGTMEETLYKIGSEDPNMWLTTEYAGSATLVYYNSSITLPSLSEMKPTLCFFCEQDNATYSIYTIGGNEDSIEDDMIVINTLVGVLNDDSLEQEIWPRADILNTYHLKFYSNDWSAIYYDVTFAVGTDKNYLYDKVTGRCVIIGDILAPYYENTYESE